MTKSPNFVSSFENNCAWTIAQRIGTKVPSYPRKRVSRRIRRKPNLDSRLRGNDESRREACGGESIHFHRL